MTETAETRNKSSAGESVFRAQGVTKAERYVQRLCERSFLRLWSYAGLHRIEQASGGRIQKLEICDMLVVFREHIIIFSDKVCEFPNTGNLDIDWARWYKRTVESAAKQIWGAETWINKHPDNIFLDPACTQKFPITIPAPEDVRIHRIIVAHGASSRCQSELGGSGSLLLRSHLTGKEHLKPRGEGGMPFVLGQVEPARGYIHILDDTTLDVLLKTLDTINDFVGYLEKKEVLMQSGRAIVVAGEEELLARYLGTLNHKREHDFVLPKNERLALLLVEGDWEKFVSSRARQAQLKANAESYLWDTLIEKFVEHAFDGTAKVTSGPILDSADIVLRFMAGESRVRRRLLAQSLAGAIKASAVFNDVYARYVQPIELGLPFYVLLVFPEQRGMSYEEYRTMRFGLLEAYVRCVKLKWPAAQDIVGISMEGAFAAGWYPDALHFDARVWTDQDRVEAEAVREQLNIMRNPAGFLKNVEEYPGREQKLIRVKPNRKRKSNGSDRNLPCSCGSGSKYKYCCGR